MGITWQSHGKNMARTWQKKAITQRDHDNIMASTWGGHGKNMARLWQYHGNNNMATKTCQ
jgi:predicted metallopeptidase